MKKKGKEKTNQSVNKLTWDSLVSMNKEVNKGIANRTDELEDVIKVIEMARVEVPDADLNALTITVNGTTNSLIELKNEADELAKKHSNEEGFLKGNVKGIDDLMAVQRIGTSYADLEYRLGILSAVSRINTLTELNTLKISTVDFAEEINELNVAKDELENVGKLLGGNDNE